MKDGKAEDADPPARADPRVPRHLEARHPLLPGVPARTGWSPRDLLTETGSIFVQIGDENVHLVRCVLDEVFGGENFCSLITFARRAGQTSEILPFNVTTICSGTQEPTS